MSRILVAYWGQHSGGVRFSRELASALAQAASAGQVVGSFNAMSRSYPTHDPHYEVTAVRVRLCRGWRLPAGLWSCARATSKLWRLISSRDVDVVVVPMESPLLMAVLWTIKPLRTIKVIVGVHDGVPHPGDRKLTFAVTRWLVLRAADGLLLFSRSVAEIVAQAAPTMPLCVSRHPSIPASIDQPRPFPEGRPLTVGFFGRLLRYKGIDLLIDACAILRADHPNFNVEICGQGEFVVELPPTLSDVTIITNRWIADDEIPAVLSRFDVLALPYVEASQSGVFALGLSSALPCVGTPVGGLMEQITQSGSGVVADACDASAFASALNRVMTDRALYEDLSHKALNAATGRFSWERTAEEVLAFVDVTPVAAAKHQAWGTKRRSV